MRLKETFASYSELKKETAQAVRYLEFAIKSADSARAKYEKDFEALHIELSKRATEAGNPLETLTSIEGRDALKPSNGNSKTKTFAEYYEKLTSSENNVRLPLREQLHSSGGNLISELREAAKRAEELSRIIYAQTERQTRVAESAVMHLDTMLARIENASSVKDSTMAKLNTHIPTVTGALGLGTQVLGSGTQSAPAPAALTGGGGGPSLATIAAAGAAGAALQSGLGASSGSSSDPSALPTTSQEPSKPLPPPETTSFGGAGANGTGDADSNALPSSDDKKKESKVEAVPEAGTFPAFGATSGGTSRMIAGTKKPPRGGAPAEGKASAGGMGDESFSNFGGGGMSPKPAPKGNQMSAGAEVANLLGQMKNLFNFDEGGAPPMGATSGDSGGYPVDPGLAAASTVEEPQAEGEYAPSEEEGQTAEETTGGESQVQAAQFGRSDTSLFSRVHSRHVRCMERGLVLYQLGERVE